MKEKYLMQIKNAMFWHFSSSEIKETIDDVNAYFKASLQDGLSEEEIIRQYGEPKMIAQRLRRKHNENEIRRRREIVFKRILLVCCVLGVFYSYTHYPLHMAAYVFIALISVLIWFAVRNDCIAGMIVITKKQKRRYFIGQVLVFSLFGVLQIFALLIMPRLFRTYAYTEFLKYVAKGQRIGIDAMLVLFCVMTVIFFVMMLKENVFIFFLVIQSMAVMCDLWLYWLWMCSQDILKPEYIFRVYWFSLLVLLVYLLYVFVKEKRKKRT